MIFLFVLAVLGNLLARLVTAAIVPTLGPHGLNSMSHAKRTDATFVWRDYPVKNCSSTGFERNSPAATILASDCQWVLNMITENNGGFFELWDFDNAEYKPLLGYQTCVLAVSHAVSNTGSDYAIVGNEDVATIMRVALHHFRSEGHVATITGSMACGPNNATLSLLVYNGLTGDGGSINATRTSLIGDAWGGGATGTGKPVPFPSVTLRQLSAETTTI